MLFPGGAIEMGFGGVGPKSGECQHGAQDRVQIAAGASFIWALRG